jgi:hypothetical protein
MGSRVSWRSPRPYTRAHIHRFSLVNLHYNAPVSILPPYHPQRLETRDMIFLVDTERRTKSDNKFASSPKGFDIKGLAACN